jgi:hypothetical protein
VRAVAFVNYNEPMQGRLMLTGRQNEMRVMWTTRDAVRPQVKFGTSPGMCIPHPLVKNNESQIQCFADVSPGGS